MKLPLYNAEDHGCIGEVELSDKVFDLPFNESLVHQVVTAYLAGGRAGTHAQKTRAEVSGGGAKPWRQKGTGRARAGTSNSPLWRGGGVTFASSPRDYSQKINRKMYRKAIACILSELVRRQKIVVLDKIEDSAVANLEGRSFLKVKEMLAWFEKHQFERSKVVFLKKEIHSEVFGRAIQNLEKVSLLTPYKLNPVALVGCTQTILEVEAIRALEGWLQ